MPYVTSRRQQPLRLIAAMAADAMPLRCAFAMPRHAPLIYAIVATRSLRYCRCYAYATTLFFRYYAIAPAIDYYLRRY